MTALPSEKSTLSVPHSSGSSMVTSPSEETEHLSFQALVNSPQFRFNMSQLILGLILVCGTFILTKRMDRFSTVIDEFRMDLKADTDKLGAKIDEFGTRSTMDKLDAKVA